MLTLDDKNKEFLTQWCQAEQEEGLQSVHLSFADPHAYRDAIELRQTLVSLILAPVVSDPELF